MITPQPVAAGMAMVEELTPEDLGLLGYGEPSPNDQRGVMTMPIAMIEEISGGRVAEVKGVEGPGKGKPYLADLMASLSPEDVEELIAAAEKRRLDQRDDVEEVDGARVRRVRLRVNPDPASPESPDPTPVTAPQG